VTGGIEGGGVQTQDALSGAETHHRRLAETAGQLGDGKLRQRLETMLGGSLGALNHAGPGETGHR